MQRNELDETQKVLESAHELHCKARDIAGQTTNDLHVLREVYIRLHKLDEAEVYDLCTLGRLFTRRDLFAEAEKALTTALRSPRPDGRSQ